MLGFHASSAAHFRNTICSLSSPYSHMHVALGSAVHDGHPLEPEAPSLDKTTCNTEKATPRQKMNYHGREFTTSEQAHLQDCPFIVR